MFDKLITNLHNKVVSSDHDVLNVITEFHKVYKYCFNKIVKILNQDHNPESDAAGTKIIFKQKDPFIFSLKSTR